MKTLTDAQVLRIAQALASNGWASGGDFEDEFLPDVRNALSIGLDYDEQDRAPMDSLREGLPVDELTRTAPKTIWLQISDDDCDREKPYPKGEEVSWCEDRVMEVEVKYVRADLANPPRPADAGKEVDRSYTVKETVALTADYHDRLKTALSRNTPELIPGVNDALAGLTIRAKEV